jgi:hypothetical protein
VQLGTMHLNSTGALKELPVDPDDDDIWVEALMGQVSNRALLILECMKLPIAYDEPIEPQSSSLKSLKKSEDAEDPWIITYTLLCVSACVRMCVLQTPKAGNQFIVLVVVMVVVMAAAAVCAPTGRPGGPPPAVPGGRGPGPNGGAPTRPPGPPRLLARGERDRKQVSDRPGVGRGCDGGR